LLGQPLRSAFAPNEITELAKRHGWRQIGDTNLQDWLKETPGLSLRRRQIGPQWLESIWAREIA
jgi:hypothetical protein